MLRLYTACCSWPGGHDAVMALLGRAWAETRGGTMPPVLKTPEGKPFFAGDPLYFSLAHARTLAACAVSDRPVGVDAELLRTLRSGLARYVCSPEELAALPEGDEALLALWTRKEAWAKYTGRGLRGQPRAVVPGDGVTYHTATLCGCVVTVCSPYGEPPERIGDALTDG